MSIEILTVVPDKVEEAKRKALNRGAIDVKDEPLPDGKHKLTVTYPPLPEEEEG